MPEKSDPQPLTSGRVQAVTIEGVVQDAASKPVPGHHVPSTFRTRRVTADAQGHFSLPAPSEASFTLEADTKELAANCILIVPRRARALLLSCGPTTDRARMARTEKSPCRSTARPRR